MPRKDPVARPVCAALSCVLVSAFGQVPCVVAGRHFQYRTCFPYDGGWEHRVNGRIHSCDPLPALVYDGGSLKWFKYGKVHRDKDLPAVVWCDNHNNEYTQEWFRNGEAHRDGDMPALTTKYGTQMWHKHGPLHRDNDLPAIIWWDGSREWFQHGHRYKRDPEL